SAQERRRHQGHRQDEGAADRRSALREGDHSRRWQEDPSGLPRGGQEAGGVEVSLGLLQDPRDDPGRAGLPSARPGRLRAGEEISTIFGVPTQALFGQLLIGLINGAFYAMLSLGLAVIFGLLNIINFAHGALYMTGAFVAYFLLKLAGLGYWWSLLLAPLCVGLLGIVLETTMLKRLYHLDHLYGLLLTFGIALVIQGVFRNEFGSSGLPYVIPSQLTGGYNLGFMVLPTYRAWVVVFSLVVCLGTWFVIEQTKLGAYLRAATENPTLVRAFGINVPRMITLTYGFGVA